MEAADQVLAGPRVDARLAADRGIDLGQERRRNLDEVDAAQQNRGGETGQVADHPAAQRDQRAAALETQLEQTLGQGFEVREALGLLAGRQHDRLVGDAGEVERALQRRQVQIGDGPVGDHVDPLALEQRHDQAPGFAQKVVAHQNVVAAFAEGDLQAAVRAHGAAPSRRDADSSARLRPSAR
jgi:hypothetical protein